MNTTTDDPSEEPSVHQGSEIEEFARQIAAVGMPDPIPDRIDRHSITAMLGAGGMGVVYAARDSVLKRTVAIKVIKRGNDSQAARVRLLREARAMAVLSHPNVVAIHDVREFEGNIYVVMDFVDGSTLQQWLLTRPNWRQVLEAFEQAGRGLAAAHAAGIVHRDFKPSNVLMDKSGIVKVTDFGIARLDIDYADEGISDSPSLLGDTGYGRSQLTATGAVLGTRYYMAPEQRLSKETSVFSDQYSFALALYEGLYGEHPFAGDTFEAQCESMLAAAVRQPPKGTTVPARLRTAVLRGLAVDPSQRWPAMDELLAEIREVLRHDPLRRRRRIALTSALLLAGTAVWGAHTWERRATSAACAAVGAEIYDIWDDSARARLEDAFLRPGMPFLVDAFDRTLPFLDRWSRSWERNADLACQAHTLTRTWDEEMYTRAQDCLDETRIRFTAFLEHLTHGDEDALMLAVDSAAQLTSVDKCTDTEKLRRMPTLKPEQRSAVLAAREQIARARTLGVAGEFKTEVLVAQEALAAARATGWPAVISQAELRVAFAAIDSGAHEEAEASLRRSLVAAKEARAIDLALAAITQIVYVVGYSLDRPAEAMVWAEAAQIQLAMLTGDNRLEWAHIDNALGIVYFQVKSYDKAMDLIARSHETYKTMLGPEHPDAAMTLSNLANIHSKVKRYTEALRLHERVLAIRRHVLGERHPDVAQTLILIAGVHEARHDHGTAIHYYTLALAVLESSLGVESSAYASALHSAALAHEHTGALREAILLFSRTLEIRERVLGPQHVLVTRVLGDLGMAYLAADQYALAVPLLDRSLVAYEVAGVEDKLAVIRFALARALWGAKGDRVRAHDLAEAARSAATTTNSDMRAVIDAWLASHQA